MLKMVLAFYDEGKRALDNGVYLNEILDLPVREKIARAKFIGEDKVSEIENIIDELKNNIDELISKGGILDA